MKKLDNKIKALILFLILMIISFIFILIIGDTYTIKDYYYSVNENQNIDVIIEDENIVKCIDKKIEDGNVKIKIESVSEGKSYLEIRVPEAEFARMFSIYVHKGGVITFNEFMGDCNGSFIIPISITIWLVYVLILLIKSYRESLKKSMYQYINIAYIGMIAFIVFAIISQILTISSNTGLVKIIERTLNMYAFAVVLLPITFVLSILVILSNISLIRKEGFNFRNVLGIILGVFLCFCTLLPEIMYKTLNTATWIDIHNQNGIGLYIYDLVETIIYIATTYIECILIGTIVMGIKTAKHIPEFDKDAIIILGCKIKKDGTLTNLLKGRVDKAIEFGKIQKEKTGKDILFVPSGGKGEDEVIAEAQAMKNYLLEQGINEEQILFEVKSKNTDENIKFSNSIINGKKENAKVAFSTTNYHVFRAGNIANMQGLDYEGIGAKTKIYFWVNAFIREFIATFANEKKKHIAVVLGIILVAIFMIFIIYLNNNM